MKLRFRGNSLRLRVNREEVQALAEGSCLEEHVYFPAGSRLSYVLDPITGPSANVSFDSGILRVAAPRSQFRDWASADSIGIYFELPAGSTVLRVAIEKDLECLHPSAQEPQDPLAFTR